MMKKLAAAHERCVNLKQDGVFVAASTTPEESLASFVHDDSVCSATTSNFSSSDATL